MNIGVYFDRTNDPQRGIGKISATNDLPSVTISTSATDSVTGTQEGTVSATASINDAVTMEGLIVGGSYRLDTTVVDKASGNTVASFTGTNGFTFSGSNATSQTETVSLPVDTSALAGHALVVYEVLYQLDHPSGQETVVARHENINDAAQTVTYPSPIGITTTALYENGTHKVAADDTSATVTDAVSMTNLDTSKTYTLETVVMDQSTNSIYSAIPAIYTNVTPTTTNYTENISITFDATLVNGKTFVIFEYLREGANNRTGATVAEHTDINDASQTITIGSAPTMATTATYLADGTHIIPITATTATVRDVVSCTGLDTTATYSLETVAVDKTTGQPISGIAPVVTDNLTPATEDVDFTVDITFDASQYRGQTIVIFEYLKLNGTVVLQHTDVNDAAQTITVTELPTPVISTVATDSQSGTHTLTLGPSSKIHEVASYSNTIPNTEYVMRTTVWDATGNKLVSEITAIDTTFTTAANGEGTVEVDINTATLPDSYYGHNLVVYEELYLNGTLVAEHKSATDTQQTVAVPQPTLTTSAFYVAGATGTTVPTTGTRVQTVPVGTNVVIFDDINYGSLVANQQYTIKSWAVLKTDGSTVTPVMTSTFTPTAANGTYTVAITPVNTTTLAGKEIVVYEQIYIGNTLIVQHVDIGDAAQTLRVLNPSITTDAASAMNGTQTLNFSANEGIRDTINFTDFGGGQQISIVSSVYDKSTGNKVSTIADVASTYTIPANGSGQFAVTIPVDATKFAGKTLVVYEKIYDASGNLLCEHCDINDARQSVSVATITTTFTGANLSSKTLDISSSSRAIDTITYSGLTPGQTYTVTGVAMIREVVTGTVPTEQQTAATTTSATPSDDATLNVGGPTDGSSPAATATATPTATPAPQRTLPADGVLQTVTMDFTPSASSGSVQVTFDLDTTGLYGYHIVAYETITVKGGSGIVAEHKDINDAAQTVVVKSTAIVQTGVDNYIPALVTASICMAVLFLGFGAYVVISLNKKKKKIEASNTEE